MEELPGGDRMRLESVKRKIYRFTYDKPDLNKKALQFQNSLDEVRKLLESAPKKNNH
jgi:hypothetical protein